jgi:site-specific recombinase XerD
MKFTLTKPRILPSGKRSDTYGYRVTFETPFEEQSLKSLYPKFKRAGSGRGTKSETEAYLHLIRKSVEHRAHLLSMGQPVGDTESIQKRITEYIEWGKLQGGKRGLPWAETHANHIEEYLKNWVKSLNLSSFSDIRQNTFERELVNLSKNNAPNTVNHKARALTALCSWAVRQGFIPLSPIRFRSLDKTPVKERGAFNLEELTTLFTQTPHARAMVYRAAYYLRLRRSELDSLKVSSVIWSEGFIRLDYKAAKDRKTAMIPVPEKLLTDLWEASQGKNDTDPLFDFSKKHAARLLHRDMARLGIPIDLSNRRRDFHSLGASTATSMDRRGIAPALASKTMRHKSWAQTENYIKLETEQVRVVTQGLEDEIEIKHTGDTLEDTMIKNTMESRVIEHFSSSPSPSALTPPLPSKTAKFRKFPRDQRKAPEVTWLKAQKILATTAHILRAGEIEALEAFLALTPKQRLDLLKNNSRMVAG